MRSYKKGLLFLVAIFISVASAMAALRGHRQQDATAGNKDDATPLRRMTERERAHSKLYGRANRKDLRKTEESVQVVFSTPFIEPDNDKLPGTIEELLQLITCNADAVVIGTVTNKTSQFTEDGSFVFTDYDLRVGEVVKHIASIPIQRNETITITRRGGAVTFDGKIVRVIDHSFEPLVAGNTYLLFLKQISATGAYQAVNSESSFELKQNKVRRLTARELPYELPYHDDAASFLARIRTVNLCNAQTREDAK